jgi:NAD(P)-dependent dehydrogenase (short-subunit alcohol dehydrogenase family)
MRLKDKVAIVVGAGQTPGDTMGNGRATAILFAREGARVVVADRDADSARETAAMIREQGGECLVSVTDATSYEQTGAMVEACLERYGRLDILHNNVGIGRGDSGPTHISEENWDRILAVNLKSVLMPCKHAIPVMRRQKGGAITNVSSAAAVCSVGLAAYKTSKAGVNALSHALACGNARYGIRVNVIMPGLINTPMAIESILGERREIDRTELIAARDAVVPLLGKQGTAWDVAYAALFLASDEAKFITGAVLPVDGGQSTKIG